MEHPVTLHFAKLISIYNKAPLHKLISCHMPYLYITLSQPSSPQPQTCTVTLLPTSMLTPTLTAVTVTVLPTSRLTPTLAPVMVTVLPTSMLTRTLMPVPPTNMLNPALMSVLESSLPSPSSSDLGNLL